MSGPLPANDDIDPSHTSVPTGRAEGPDASRAEKDTVSQSLDGSLGAPRTAPSESALSGEFGRYRILRRLGKGGMGTVYLAHDSQLDRPVALKVPHFLRDEGKVVERFLREARAMATLRHANLCPVFDAGERDGVHYLTMAYIEGDLLADLLKRPEASCGLDSPRVVDVVHKLALALGEAHAAGVIHRDLKPSNIMVDKRGEPVIMDFGLAHRDQEEGTRLTGTGAMLGTPAYMPPEQFEQAEFAHGPATDVYSLGVIFYQLLCGRLPFRGNLAAIVAQVLTSSPPRPSSFRQDIDPALEELCLKAMSRNPTSRFPSMHELAAALESFRHGRLETQLVERRKRAAERPAFVADCVHDVFISYAAIDDEPPPGTPAAGWVSTLADHLEWRLRQICGCPQGLSLWMDPRLAADPQLDAAFAERLRRTATVLIIVSPAYAHSAWSNPAGPFLELLRQRPNPRQNVILVERDRTDPSELAFDSSESRRIRFWDDREGRGARTFGHPQPRPDVDIDYYAKIDDLARAVHESFSPAARRAAAWTGGAETPQSQPGRSGPKGTVYLAEVTDDLDPLRDGVERCLSQAGFHVVPATWFPREAEQFRQAARNCLKDALLYVQLLGSVTGKRPAGSTRSYAAMQRDAAVEAGVPIVLWRDPALDTAAIRDDEQRGLVESPDVLAVELEQFKRAAVRRAQQELALREAGAQAAAGPDRAFVFVNVERGDLPLADDLCRLLEQSGCSFALPLSEGRPDEIRRDLESNLLDCDGLIVVYGSITEHWVREQLRQWRKMLYLREKPLRALAVFEGPPPDKHALGMRFPQMHVINCRTGVQPDKVRAFVDAVTRAAREH